MMILFIMLIFSFLHRIAPKKNGYLWFVFCLAFSYTATVFVNGVRIIVSIYLPPFLEQRIFAETFPFVCQDSLAKGHYQNNQQIPEGRNEQAARGCGSIFFIRSIVFGGSGEPSFTDERGQQVQDAEGTGQADNDCKE